MVVDSGNDGEGLMGTRGIMVVKRVKLFISNGIVA